MFGLTPTALHLVSKDSHAERVDINDLIDRGDKVLMADQTALERKYKISSFKHFHWDQHDEQLIFSNNGKPAVIAQIQFVGDVSKSSHTWLWSWANHSVDDGLKISAKKVRAIGLDNGYTKLTQEEWPADQGDGWDMTALTVLLTHAVGAYRTDDPNGYQFMVITKIWRVQSHRIHK